MSTATLGPSANAILNRVAYSPPTWLVHNLKPEFIPSTRIQLGRFPTPVHHFNIPGIERLELSCFIKRDDLSSFDLSGNKVRKLEFLMAEATKDGSDHDCVITIGGLQSNHARATAVAARQLGLDPYLILRTRDEAKDVELVGNLLLDRLVGSDIRLVSPGTYGRVGSVALTQQLAEQLRSEGRNPYVIPVGGSNTLGAFGYMDAIREIIDQELNVDHIVFACGSGGTAAGIALGVHFAGLSSKVHAVCVCDTPEYFYNHVDEVLQELNVADSDGTKISARQLLTVYQGQGTGYARSTPQELDFLAKVALSTGVVLDPVYSGKALYNFASIADSHPEIFNRGDKVLFLHTGGTLGLYDKSSEILPFLPAGQVSKMEVRLPN
jgi:D-cysteine desulfhydrase family pyridoxal phosphate-dependent enzyme